MNNKKLNLSQAVAIVLLVLLQVMASAAFAQKKESYTGGMTVPNDIPMIVLQDDWDYKPGESYCEANYEYYVNSQGERVKDGKFELNCSNKCIISGGYKDGKKDGNWTFTKCGQRILKSYLKENPSYSIKYASFNYVDDVRKGDFTCTVCRNKYFVDIEGRTDNDHLVGKSSFVFRSYADPENACLKVDAYFDQDGNPEKEWILESTSGKLAKDYLTYENGVLVKAQHYDESTGQRKVVVDSKPDTSKSKYLTGFSKDDYVLEQVDGFDFYLSKNAVPYQKGSLTVKYQLGREDYKSSVLDMIVGIFKQLDFNVIDRKCDALAPAEREYWGCKVDEMASSVVADYNALCAKIRPLKQSQQMYYVPAGKKHDLFNDANVIVRDYLGVDEEFQSFNKLSLWLQGCTGVSRSALSSGIYDLKFEAHSYLHSSKDVADMKKWMTDWKNAKTELAGLNDGADKQVEARAKMDEVTQNMIRVDADMSGKQKKYFTNLVKQRDAAGIIEFFENPDVATNK